MYYTGTVRGDADVNVRLADCVLTKRPNRIASLVLVVVLADAGVVSRDGDNCALVGRRVAWHVAVAPAARAVVVRCAGATAHVHSASVLSRRGGRP